MNLTNNMGMFVSAKLECGFLNVISAKIDNNTDYYQKGSKHEYINAKKSITKKR